MQVILSSETEENMNSLFEYIQKDSLKYAIETTRNIRLAIHRLEDFPYIGRYVPEKSSKQFRERIYKSYRIVYEVSEELDSIYIHFIIHGKRNFKSFYKSYLKNNF